MHKSSHAEKLTAGTDITWPKFLCGFATLTTINGVIRDHFDDLPLSVSVVEEVMHYTGFMLGMFFLAALIIVPFHFIGKRHTAGYAAPKLLVLIWACFFAAALLARFLLKR